MSQAYKKAGVDVEAGYQAVKLMKKHIQKTMRPEVLTEIGGFGGLFSLANMNMEEPVLVSGTDGVGTKLKIAFLMDKHDTVGIDCVAMCANDVICSGAQPLFFLDYIATGKTEPEKIEKIVKGVSDGCLQSGCALIGGETAEMPGFYTDDEYDMAGFVVGIVDKKTIIDGKSIKPGDKLIGISSSGIHSNGYSLVRKVFDVENKSIKEYNDFLGCSVGEELLKPTKIYAKVILDVIKKFNIKGISHITGGGFIENIPRMMPKGTLVKINKDTWPILPIFKLLQKEGNISEEDMFNTFNMGIGMVLAIDSEKANELVDYINNTGEKAYLIGEVEASERGETIKIC